VVPVVPVDLGRQLHMLLVHQLHIRLLLVQVVLDMQAAQALQGRMAQILYSDHLHQLVAVEEVAVHRPELLVKQVGPVVDLEELVLAQVILLQPPQVKVIMAVVMQVVAVEVALALLVVTVSVAQVVSGQ
jgi:hypothetical protein